MLSGFFKNSKNNNELQMDVENPLKNTDMEHNYEKDKKIIILENFLKNFNNGLIILDKNSQILEINQKAEEILESLGISASSIGNLDSYVDENNTISVNGFIYQIEKHKFPEGYFIVFKDITSLKSLVDDVVCVLADNAAISVYNMGKSKLLSNILNVYIQ